MAHVVVLIVGYRNADDIEECLRALAAASAEPSFDVYVAENGGDDAMNALAVRLGADGSVCRADPSFATPAVLPRGSKPSSFRLIRPDGSAAGCVFVAQPSDNLGYAGGVNFWLRPLLDVEGWDAAWILNPDTTPAPSALAELAAYSRGAGKGMVGSCLVRADRPDLVATRGLAWRKWRGRTLAVDRLAPIAFEPDAVEVEARLWAPSGASVYATRRLIDEIGLMDERYFLYFEDLEWGTRARQRGEIGYAHRSVVPHKQGTTIGSASTRAGRSPLSVYLSARNAVLFVRAFYPRWLLWTLAMQSLHLATYGAVGAFANMGYGLRGLLAGLRGETGRPDAVLARHRPNA